MVMIDKSAVYSKMIKRKFVRGKAGHVLNAQYFYYETDPAFKKDLAIVCGGWEKCAPDYMIDRTSYPYHVIKYTISGRGLFLKNGQSFPISPNTLSGFGPKDVHRYSCDLRAPLEHIFIIFTGSYAAEIFKQSTLNQRGAFTVTNPAQSLYLLRSLMKTALSKPPYSQQICCSYLKALLLNQAATTDDMPQQSGAFETYLYCKKYLDDNFSNIDSIAAASRACDINIRYMARLFRRFLKLTPHEYVMRLRLNKAANLLLTTDSPVNKIAE